MTLRIRGGCGQGSSPHTRGAPSPGARAAAGRGIIPAYAGSTVLPRKTPQTATDHPRIRGEHMSMSVFEMTSPGSSPHTRGAPEPAPHPSATRRIIPAYAGSTVPVAPGRSVSMDHPRIRGEHRRRPIPSYRTRGSSPHTRGAPPARGVFHTFWRIIPAYAGSTRESTSS